MVKLKLKVGLMNDAFPPTLDGTATTTLNYAEIIHRELGESMVITPRVPHVRDSYPFEVYRYDSFPYTKKEEYRIGWPFRHALREYVRSKELDLLHFHCPLASGYFAKLITDEHKIPVVATYHTKYDYDVRQRMPTKFLQDKWLHFIVYNMSNADEVWAVSNGAGENLRSIGYQGDYRVMPNGVDFPRGKAGPDDIRLISLKHQIPEHVPVFLYVGRMMWYKNIRIILEALKIVQEQGQDFRFIMIGKGAEEGAIDHLIAKLGLSRRIIRTGKVSNRAELRAYYSRADVFLFPSTFDSHGLVVREAAACECPSLLVRGSSSAEGIEDGVTGYLSEENARDFAARLQTLLKSPETMRRVGQNASEHIYLSWEDAVKQAYTRYEEICDAWPHPLPCKNKA